MSFGRYTKPGDEQLAAEVDAARTARWSAGKRR